MKSWRLEAPSEPRKGSFVVRKMEPQASGLEEKPKEVGRSKVLFFKLPRTKVICRVRSWRWLGPLTKKVLPHVVYLDRTCPFAFSVVSSKSALTCERVVEKNLRRPRRHQWTSAANVLPFRLVPGFTKAWRLAWLCSGHVELGSITLCDAQRVFSVQGEAVEIPFEAPCISLHRRTK